MDPDSSVPATPSVARLKDGNHNKRSRREFEFDATAAAEDQAAHVAPRQPPQQQLEHLVTTGPTSVLPLNKRRREDLSDGVAARHTQPASSENHPPKPRTTTAEPVTTSAAVEKHTFGCSDDAMLDQALTGKEADAACAAQPTAEEEQAAMMQTQAALENSEVETATQLWHDLASSTMTLEFQYRDDILLAVLRYAKSKWMSDALLGENDIQEGARKLGIPFIADEGSVSFEALQRAADCEHLRITRLELGFRRCKLIAQAGRPASEFSHGMDFSNDFNRLRDVVIRFTRLLVDQRMARKAKNPALDTSTPSYVDPLMSDPNAMEGLSPYQKLLRYLLNKLLEGDYRRYRDGVWSQVPSPMLRRTDGSLRSYPTHAWREAPAFAHAKESSVKQFVLMNCDKVMNPEQWKVVSSPAALDNAVRYLLQCTDLEFRDLKPDRHWFAFNNGLYNASEAKFYQYGDMAIPPQVVACEYHDCRFTKALADCTKWDQVQTPSTDKIIDYQMHPAKNKDVADAAELRSIKLWIYAMCGRCLFDVNEKDHWEIMPFFVGRAGTGKSTILKAVRRLYSDKDVGTISNNANNRFALQDVYDKLLVESYEIKDDFGLDQTQWQSMISGEEVTVQRKGTSDVTVIWTAPFIGAGNEMAGFRDNSGSVLRRMLMINFDFRVAYADQNPMLDRNIKEELPYFLHKSSLAYLLAVKTYGHCAIWGSTKDENGRETTILPQYFHMGRDRLHTSTHPVAAFLRNENAIVTLKGIPKRADHPYGMPFAKFKQLANTFMESNNIGKNFSWQEAKYKSVLQEAELEVGELKREHVENGENDYRGTTYSVKTPWIWGVIEVDELKAWKLRPESEEEARMLAQFSDNATEDEFIKLIEKPTGAPAGLDFITPPAADSVSELLALS